jgi:small subunit ribosomal protein S21
MIIVNVSKEKNLESALKKYKYKVQKTKQTEKLREKQEYTKPSVERRGKKLKAIYKQQLFTDQEKSN